MARHSAVLHTLAVSGEDTEPKAAATDDTEDAISITSTPYASDDSQREYLVEDILAQDDSDGDVKYLVQWTGYPLEECTWELGENMDSGLLRDLWDDKIAKKSYRPFDITLFYDAIARKQSRHFRRNLMRKARGLPQTFPFENESESSAVCETAPEATVALEGKAAKASRDTALSTTELVGANAPSIDLTDIIQESDEDVVALDKISTPATAKPKKEKKKKQKAAQPKGKKKEDPKPASEKKPDAVASGPADNAPTISTASSVLSGQAEQLGKKPPSGSAKKLKSVEPPLAPQASAVASRSLSRQNAHPPLRGGSQVAAKMPSVKASTAAKKAGSSKTDTEAGGVKTFSARKSSKSTQQTGNAFNSGKKIRVRPNLVTAMSDPSKPQHLFTSRRQLRIAEQQERDKPDAAIEASRLTAHLFPISAGPPAALSIMAKTSNQQKGLLKNLGAPDTSTQALQALRKKSVHFSDVGDDNESVVTRIRLISPPYEGPASSEDDDMAMHLETIVTGLQLPDRAVKLFIGTQEVPLSVISSATAYEDGTQGVLDEVFENNSLHLRYAVYWRNADEAMKQSQSRSFNFSIEKWFEFSSAARNKGRPYVGFFNMPIDSSGTDSEKQEGKPTRQPFVAIYRPMNSKSNKTIKTAELIFWDCRAKSKFQGQSVLYRNDLTSAQLAVVDYVLEYGFERHRMNLGRVFIGGEPFQSRNPGDLPKVLFKRPVSGLGSPPDQVPFNNNDIDATMEFIDEMASDFIEPPGQLGQQGQQHPARQAGLEETKKQIDSTGKQQGGDSKNAKTGFNENTRIVFHAPRGDRMRHGKASNCSNRFFEAARVAKMRTPQQNMMSFDFLPTMEWYGHQVVEDRGYEHLHVNSWKSFFNTYGIEQ
ncbi:hypothetical protein SEPCBS57363_005011 [Sporothrix epigloea]|uniref:Chromo domain-containing protein n=1 Tax=Sporothrix epigloea TaxID=1892477 RepID=A0ABP0DZ45_9PEZI